MINTKKNRSSNFELVRIIAMCMIVLNHFSNYSGLMNSELHTVRAIGYFFIIGGKYGSALFVLIGSYFMAEKPTKAISMLRIWFYTVAISILCRIVSLPFGVGSINEIYKSLFPVLFNAYWFVTVYLALLLVSPWLSRYIKTISRNAYRNLLIVLFIILSLIPTVLSGRDLYCNEFVWFIYLFLIAGYFKQFDVRKGRIGLLVISTVSWLLMWVILIVSEGEMLFIRDSGSILVLIGSVSLFLLLKNTQINTNRLINICGMSTFSVYLIHDNHLFRRVLWESLLPTNRFVSNNPIAIIIIGGVTVIILFTVGIIMEYLLSIVWNLLSKFFSRITPKLDRLLSDE